MIPKKEEVANIQGKMLITVLSIAADRHCMLKTTGMGIAANNYEGHLVAAWVVIDKTMGSKTLDEAEAIEKSSYKGKKGRMEASRGTS